MGKSKSYTTAKERSRAKLLEFLGDPENDFLNRSDLSTLVLGYKKPNQIYQLFKPDELSAIEREALDIRRARYSRLVSVADQGLLRKASEGDPAACRLVYQRFEGWSEKQKVEHSGSIETGPPILNIHINREKKHEPDPAPPAG